MTGCYSIGFNLGGDLASRATIRLREAEGAITQTAENPIVTLTPPPESIAPPPPPTRERAPDDGFLAAAFAEAPAPPAETATTRGFKSGTHIRTARGLVAVEALAAGDDIVTPSGALRRVKSIERRLAASDGRGSLTIRIARGAFSDHVPSQDLWLAPEQAVVVGDVLVAAGALINGVSVLPVHAVDPVACVHVVLEQPDMLIAEAAPVESFSITGLERASGAERERVCRQVAARAGVEALPETDPAVALAPVPGRLRGFVEDCSPARIAGWAQDVQNASTPVPVAILLDGTVLAEMVADRWRRDLQAAKIGEGRHAFEYRPATPIPREKLGGVKVIRTTDGAILKAVDGLVR